MPPESPPLAYGTTSSSATPGAAWTDGTVLGDAAYVEFTDLVRRLGWRDPEGSFDILPWVIHAADDKPQLFDVPRDLVLEVTITHPDCPRIADLGLRWHAVPAISNMCLRIGGINYPLAPFNGWYMGTEIGARNLVDEDRYNLLPDVAACFGMDTSKESTLWRDRALVELNVAVLHSFHAAGVPGSPTTTQSRATSSPTWPRRSARAGPYPRTGAGSSRRCQAASRPSSTATTTTPDQRPNFYPNDPAHYDDSIQDGCPYRQAVDPS